MQVIHKYSVRHDRTLRMSKAAFMLPKNGRILKVAKQGDDICWWVISDQHEVDVEARYFYIIDTDWLVPDGSHYLDTFFEDGLVWHIFEEQQ